MRAREIEEHECAYLVGAARVGAADLCLKERYQGFVQRGKIGKGGVVAVRTDDW